VNENWLPSKHMQYMAEDRIPIATKVLKSCLVSHGSIPNHDCQERTNFLAAQQTWNSWNCCSVHSRIDKDKQQKDEPPNQPCGIVRNFRTNSTKKTQTFQHQNHVDDSMRRREASNEGGGQKQTSESHGNLTHTASQESSRRKGQLSKPSVSRRKYKTTPK
jgi:hypothetical protein